MTVASALAALFETASHHWWQIKEALKSLGPHADVLHILVGVLIQVSEALVLRRPLTSALPWLAVLTLELANEAGDLVNERWPDRSPQAESAGDLALTLPLPTLLMLIAWGTRVFRR